MTSNPANSAYVTVTVLEADVLAGLAAGHTWSAVARAVSMTEENAKKLGRGLYRKLGVANSAQAVAIAYESGVLPRRDPGTMRISLQLTATDASNLDAMCTEGFRALRDDYSEGVRSLARAVLYRVQAAIAAGRHHLTDDGQTVAGVLARGVRSR